MPTVFDYLKWRGDMTFEETPVSEADNLIFCLLAYADLDGIVPSSSKEGVKSLRAAAMEYFFRRRKKEDHPLGLILPPAILTLFRAMAGCPRFRDLELTGYVNEVNVQRDMQFSAITIRLPKDQIFVAFSGTDDSIVGWREDFCLSFMQEIPSQRKATEYLNTLDLTPETSLYVGGHSKGGNLAVWGATHAKDEVRKAIKGVYSNDGPGFSRELIHSPAYRDLKDRLHVFIPDDSLVGLLLEHDEDYTVIKSSRRGILQHDGLTWEIMGSKFCRAGCLSPKGVHTDTVLRSRIDSMTREERERFIRIFFAIIESTGATTLTDLMDGSGKRAVSVIKALRSMTVEDRKSAIFLLNKLMGKATVPPRLPTRSVRKQPFEEKGKVYVTLAPFSSVIIRIF